jgi:hypothetical protein
MVNVESIQNRRPSSYVHSGSLDKRLNFESFYTGYNNQLKKQNLYNELYTFEKYRINNPKDLFLRDFLLSSLKKKGLKIPEDLKIEIIAPLTFDEEHRYKLKRIVFGHFKGYSSYFFELMNMPEETFKKKVDTFKIPFHLKQELNEIYKYLDGFYKVKLTLPDGTKSYDLTTLTEKDRTEIINKLKPHNPELAEELLNMTTEVKQFAKKFSCSEMERQALYEAGESSRNFIIKLIAGIVALMGIDNYVRPALVAKMGTETLMGKGVNKITEFVAGCGDDVLGSYKDYFQDEITLGKKNAQNILGLSVLAGVLSSIAVVPLNFNTPLGAIAYGNGSSGSSIFSNIATFSYMYKNYDDMVAKGIITPEKGKKLNSGKFKTVLNNYFAYDAYFGKVIGILACTPAAYIAYRSGAFSKQASSLTKTAALTIVGSVESYLTVAIQLLRDNARKAKIQTSSDIIARGDVKSEAYDSRKFQIKQGTKDQLKQSFTAFINFFKTFRKD